MAFNRDQSLRRTGEDLFHKCLASPGAVGSVVDSDGMEKHWWPQLRSSVAELAMPAQCVNCGAWESWLCPVCSTGVAGRILRRNVAVGGMPGVVVGVSSATPYSGIGKRVVLAHKQQGLRPLSRVIATWLVTAIESVLPEAGPTWLVPVPATARSWRKRGRDPWSEVCLAASESLGPDVSVAQMLTWRTRAHPQKNLSRMDRSNNVANKMAIRSGIVEELLCVRESVPTLVLVDDVVTTGATLGECARALYGVGMVCSGAATVCAVAGE